jgi:hypothetical protein
MLIEPWRRRSLSVVLAVFLETNSSVCQLTLNICNTLLEDLLQNLGVLELLLDLGNDALGELLLLPLLDLALVTHPRIQNRLGLSRESGPLLELVSLSLELGGFLPSVISASGR